MKKLKEKITKNSVRFNFCVSSGATLNVFKQEENMTVNLGRLVWKYSCLENPRDGGAWWAAFYGVAQSRTRLKRLSSSSSCSVDGLQPTRVPCQGDLTGKNIGVSCHSLLQGLFHHPGIKPRFPALQVDSLPLEPPGKPKYVNILH